MAQKAQKAQKWGWLGAVDQFVGEVADNQGGF